MTSGASPGSANTTRHRQRSSPGRELSTQRRNVRRLIRAVLFDVFTDATGQRLAADRKSVAWRISYRDKTRTLESAEVDTTHARVLEALKKALPVSVR